MNAEVKLGADTSGLKSGMDSAASVARDKLGQIGNYLKGIAADGKTTERDLAGVFDKIKGAFSGTAASAESASTSVVGSFSLMRAGVAGALAIVGAAILGAIKGIDDLKQEMRAVEQLRNVFAMTSAEASHMNVALTLVGKTSDDYANIALKLARSVKDDEQRLRELGVATRNARGEFLPLNTLMNNALGTMQQYKAGVDQDLFAMEAFGRSAKDVYGFLEVNESVLKRAAELQRELGIEMGPDKRAAIKAYQIEVQALGVVWGEVRQALGEALMPVLKAFASWVSTTGITLIREFGASLRTFADEWTLLAAHVASATTKIGNFFANTVVRAQETALIVKMAVAGQWGEIPALVAAANQRVITNNLTTANKVVAIWDEASKKIATKAGGPAGLGSDAPTGGGRRFPVKAKGGGAEDSQMAGLEAELRRQENAYNNMKLDQGSFETWSVAQTRKYWADVLAVTNEGSKDYLAIRNKFYAADRSVQQQAFSGFIADLDAQRAAIKFDGDARIALAEQAAAAIAQKSGAGSAEAIRAQQEVTREYQRESDRRMRIVDIERRQQEVRAQGAATLEQMTIAQRVAMGEISVQQALAAEVQLQGNLLSIRRTALENEIALLDELDPKRAELNARIEAMEIEHQAKLTDIANKAVLDRAQYELQAMDAIRSDMKSFLADFGKGPKTIKQQFMDLFDSIDQRLRKMIADKLIDQLFGGGTQGGGFLMKLLGMLGGGMGGGGMSGGIADIGAGGGGGLAFAAAGTPYVKSDGLAFIHKGEAIIPAARNKAGGGMVVNNNFNITGPVDSRTQNQIAAATARGLYRVNLRDN